MSLPIFRPYEGDAAFYICENMRQSDAREVFAFHPEWDHYRLFSQIHGSQPFLYCEIVWSAEMSRPVAIMAAQSAGINVAQAMMFGTDDLSALIMRAMIRRARRVGLPILQRQGIHRVQATSISDYRQAHRFIRAAGGEFEGRRRALGKNGEDYCEFSWIDHQQLQAKQGEQQCV